MDSSQTSPRQIASADVILLNKVDLVDDKQKSQTISAIR